MADMIITNQTNNTYLFGPYQLAGGIGTATVTIDTTTNASLYLTNDAFADVVNALYTSGSITVTNQPSVFPRVTGVPQLLHGDGNPEGSVFATQGSAFMRRDASSANNSLYAKTTGPSLSTGWKPYSGGIAPTPATTLPGSPSDGQQAILTDSTSAPTYNWFFQWSAAASKWIFIGGSPAYSEVQTAEATTSTTYVALTTAGPSFTVPRAGDYYVSIGAAIDPGGLDNAFMSYDIGGTGAVDADQIIANQGSNTTWYWSVSRDRLKTGLAASTALVAKYKSGAGANATFKDRWMSVLPRNVT